MSVVTEVFDILSFPIDPSGDYYRRKTNLVNIEILMYIHIALSCCYKYQDLLIELCIHGNRISLAYSWYRMKVNDIYCW